MHNRRISEQIVRNHLRESHLRACRPHQGLVTDFSGKMLTFDGHWQTGEPYSQLYWADSRQRGCRCVGERLADVNVVNRVPHGGGGVMVLAGISYGQQTQLHFMDGNLNAEIP
jgi:hypothetical protein